MARLSCAVKLVAKSAMFSSNKVFLSAVGGSLLFNLIGKFDKRMYVSNLSANNLKIVKKFILTER